MNSIPGNASQEPTSKDTSTTGVQQNQTQREDYLDKGLDAAEKKFGGVAGQDTEKNRGINEKIVRLAFMPFQVASSESTNVDADRWRS
jgi:hypothetical protein